MKTSVEEDYVPKDNTDLVRVYRPYVTRLVLKYNRVSSNFDDLLQHVWDQLFTVKMLDKYHKSAGVQLPKEITALQAASMLQMKWDQFKIAIWRASIGDIRDPIDQVPQSIKQKVFARDHGVCSRPCHGDKPLNAETFRKDLASLKAQDPEGYASAKARLKKLGLQDKKVFWVAEKVSPTSKGKTVSAYKTTCVFCLYRDRQTQGYMAGDRKRGQWAPTRISGTWASKKAVYLTADIEKFRDQRKMDNRTKTHLDIQPWIETTAAVTPSHFKRYLARSVHNIYANWCRTRARKYKELYLAPTEDGQAWESFLEDTSDMNPETKVIITEEANASLDTMVSKLAKKVKKGEIDGGEIAKMIAEGYTLAEIIKEKNLPRTLLQVARRREG